MKKNIATIILKNTLIVLFVLMISSCGEKDKQEQLDELIAKRDKLTEQINQLQKEIRAEGGTAKNEKIASVKIDEVKSTVFKHFIEVQGTIESDNNISIPFQMGGIVTKIYVKEGDYVTKGKLIAEVDGSIYERNIESLEINFEMAKTAYERQKRLWDQNIGSEMQYLQIKTQKESLEKQLEAMREQYKLTKIYAQISGTVDEISVKEGEMAAPGRPAVRLVKLSALKIEASLSEEFISSVSEKDMVDIEIPAASVNFSQPITAVSKVIDPNNRTFNIEIKIPRKIDNVKPNMLAVLTINDYTNKDALVVPLNAVQKTDKLEFVYIAEQNDGNWVSKKQTVKTGKYYNNKTEILEGLKAGEKIIVEGYNQVGNNQKLNVVE